jgi:ATP-dependent DNA ligase
VEAVNRLKVRSCLLDGEAVRCDEDGLAVFALLRYRARPAEIFLYAFDLLEWGRTQYGLRIRQAG